MYRSDSDELVSARTELVSYSARLLDDGLAVGSAGNMSVRAGGVVAITPSGISYADLRPADICLVTPDGTQLDGPDAETPSSETPMHLAIYAATGAAAVVHTHSPEVIALSATRTELPAIHYAITGLGGPVRVAPYVRFGSAELAAAAVEALDGRSAVILRNHGAVTYGRDLAQAYDRALLLEWLTRTYRMALCYGEPAILSAAELDEVTAETRRRRYGERRSARIAADLGHPGGTLVVNMSSTEICLASIHIYPMKAGRAVDLDVSAVEPWGLAGDRRWLLVDSAGRFVSQREEPSLARVVVRYGPLSGTISVSAAGRPRRRIAAPAGTRGAEMLKVTVWSSTVLAAAAGPAADAWFSAYLGRKVRLVYLDDPSRRPVDPEYGREGDVVSFADGYPLLLTSAASLGELGRWLSEDREPPVPMTRFRPSVVVAGAPPWAEDRWRRVRIGPVPFRVVKPCGRCVVTTTDQITGERGRQPLKMLGRRRRFGQALVFGQNLIPDAPGVIRVGDPVEILQTA